MSKTRDNRIPEDCKQCKYFLVMVRSNGRRWLEICRATGERLVWEDGELKKSDICPYMYSGVKHV